MIQELEALMAGVTKNTDASNLLSEVQKIVFGESDVSKRYWNTGRRIDDFDFSKEGFGLSIGDGTLQATFRFNVTFEKQEMLKLVA